jgi:hypothetical protein
LLHDVEARQSHIVCPLAHPPEDLRRDDHVLPPIAQRLGQLSFRIALAVDVGRIEEIDSSVDGLTD